MRTWKSSISFSQSSLIALLFLAYRWSVGPVFYGLGARCRFEPSCSQFGEEAMQKFGLIKGGVMAIGRVCRCHPFHRGGLNPVPNRFRVFKQEGSRDG